MRSGGRGYNKTRSPVVSGFRSPPGLKPGVDVREFLLERQAQNRVAGCLLDGAGAPPAGGSFRTRGDDEPGCSGARVRSL